ncbi:MAG: hypothetical protein E7A66_08950, partial [Staphylococcus lugdunensis]|nr:hypothetical protein [Staphylococcus lugdunensis]
EQAVILFSMFIISIIYQHIHCNCNGYLDHHDMFVHDKYNLYEIRRIQLCHRTIFKLLSPLIEFKERAPLFLS